ncbi:hypothetical protein FOMPIDRAFT_1055790 [Fomitopsis schrenkii]|uniref:Uncharacterized protein n=1 Tax=Fomitopsis schrenkii TaxID=2126942 RepID=S8DQY8_FOMSC|nr:hypothetical protein FOMPIDRAFT_1055790 [Fomitopsis schrenkii]
MLTSHQIQTINGIVDGVENEDEVEQLALSERKRQRAESIADAAHTVLNILRDDMADADRAAYDSLYAALSASAQEPGATRHLDAARAMWRWTLDLFSRLSTHPAGSWQWTPPSSPTPQPRQQTTVPFPSALPGWNHSPWPARYIPVWNWMPVLSWCPVSTLSP